MITEFKIFELFDFNYDIEIMVESVDEFKCKFSLDGEDYFFHARDENKMFPEFIRYGWHLTFGIVGPDKYKLTGKNIPFKVLSGVKRCYEMFIDKYDPDKMSFIAEGEKKAVLYLSMFKGYKVSKRESGLESYSGYTPYLFMMDKKMNENADNELDPYGEERWDDDLKEEIEVIYLHDKIADNKQDAFWYYGEAIAELRKGENWVTVYPTGDIRIRFEENGRYYYNREAVGKATELGWTDQDLADCMWMTDNNWFDFEINGVDGCDSPDGVSYEYDEAIESARSILEEL